MLCQQQETAWTGQRDPIRNLGDRGEREKKNMGSLLVGREAGFKMPSGSRPLLGTMTREPALGEPEEA